MCKVATTFKRMDNSPKGRRMHSLTADTSNALHRTLSGLVALIKYKLDVGYKYVLPGKDQSDKNRSRIRHLQAEQWWKLLYINISSVQWLEVTANKTVSSIGNVRKAAHQCKRPMLWKLERKYWRSWYSRFLFSNFCATIKPRKVNTLLHIWLLRLKKDAWLIFKRFRVMILNS